MRGLGESFRKRQTRRAFGLIAPRFGSNGTQAKAPFQSIYGRVIVSTFEIADRFPLSSMTLMATQYWVAGVRPVMVRVSVLGGA